MRQILFTSLFVTMLLASACGERRSDPAPGAVAGAVLPAAQTVRKAAAPAPGGEEQVTFTTGDGIVIAGTLYPAAAGSPAVLCLHQWRSERSEFAAFARTLQAAGITALTIDMRGYGGSTRSTGGTAVEPGRITVADIEAAVAFLRKQKSVDAARIALVGASYGSSNAIIYAADHAEIRAVALLSPGLNYHKVLPTEPAVKKYGSRPLLAIAGSEDMRSVEAVARFRDIAGSGITTKLYENGGHGVDLFRAHPASADLVLEFLQKNLRR
jgi:dienelactone hydrolase